MPAYVSRAGGPYGQGNFRFTWYGDRIIQEVNAATTRAARRTADQAMMQARSLVPVDTGALRDSIDYELRPTQTGFALVIFAGEEYALYVELGTMHMSARPYLRPVLDQINNIYRGFLSEEMQRVA